MWRVPGILMLCGGVAAGAWAAGRASAPRTVTVYADAVYGYTFEPQFPAVAPGGRALSAMFVGPAADGFARNVNVVVARVSVSGPEYRQQSYQQMRALGATLVSEKDLHVSGRYAFESVWDADQQGRSLRYLTLTVVARDRVLVFTCTALRDSYSRQEGEFRRCLRSIRLTR